jgi:hypothetical protein
MRSISGDREIGLTGPELDLVLFHAGCYLSYELGSALHAHGNGVENDWIGFSGKIIVWG